MKKYRFGIISYVAFAAAFLTVWAFGNMVLNKEHVVNSCQKTLPNDEIKIKEIVASDLNKIETVEFCGVTFGVNVKWIGSDDDKVPKSITLLTSHQDKKSFEAIKEGISKYLGNPNVEDYDVGDDNRVYGRVEWNKGFSVTLRNVHSDEGGLILFIM
ncbi:MAG: hypothetical protein J6T44_07845 [Prevotella sp.]|nr:hypothetical protein [Prevotella sp.]